MTVCSEASRPAAVTVVRGMGMGLGVLAATARRSALLGVAGVTLLLASCGGAHDGDGGLTKEDYEALKSRRPAPDVRTLEEPPIPDLQPILAAPQPPSLADSRRVSVQATEPTPVRDLLIEIARRADIDLELDPRIEGGVIITARDRPIKDVVESIADLAALRYEFANNRLRVELDEPYLDSYRVDALSVRRATTSSISSSTDVFSAVGEGAAAGNNASTTQVTSEARADVWEEVSDNVEAIVNQRSPLPRTVVTAATTPASGAGGAATAPIPAPVASSGGGGPGAEAGTAAGPVAPPTDPIAPAAAAAASAAAAPVAAPASAAESDDPEATESGDYFTINRQAGVVTVFTTQRKHRKIAKYLEAVQRNTSAQVLIEAKILEVTLSDQFRAGIDWNIAFNGFTAVTNLTQNLLDNTGLTNPLGNMALTGGRIGNVDIGAAVDFIDQFGSTRTLSSPRLTVLNNQNAILKVAENEVYFTIEIEREIDTQTNRETRTYTSEVHTVPIGVIMSVQPSINAETGDVKMNLRPTVSRITRRVADPAVDLQVAEIRASSSSTIPQIQSTIPVVEVRELDSMVTMRSGDVLALGGLMQERGASEVGGVPGVQDVPLLGAAFRKEAKDTNIVELVIFLRATIVNGRDSVHPADIELYNKFTPDPRPIAF